MLDQRQQTYLYMTLTQIESNSKLKSAEIRAIIFKADDPTDESNPNYTRLKNNPWRTCGIVIKLSNKNIDENELNNFKVESELEGIKFLQGYFSIDYIIDLIKNLINKDIKLGEYQIFGEPDYINYRLETSQDSDAMKEFGSPCHVFNCYLECRENGRDSIREVSKYPFYRPLEDRFSRLALPYPDLPSMMYYKLGLATRPSRYLSFGMEEFRSIEIRIFIPTLLPMIEDFQFYSKMLWIKIRKNDENDDLSKLALEISLIATNYPNWVKTIVPNEENTIEIPHWPDVMHIVLGYKGEKIDEQKYFQNSDDKRKVYVYDEDWKEFQNELQELRNKFQNIKAENVDVFLSHSTKDLSIITPIDKALERLGLSVFISEEIKREGSYIEKIENHLHGCKIFLSVLTENGCSSQFVQQEIGYAYSLNKKIVTIIGPSQIQKGFITIHDPIELSDNLDETICKIILFFRNNFSTLLDLSKIHVICPSCNEKNILAIPPEEEVSKCIFGKKPIVKTCSTCLNQIKLNPYTFSTEL